MAIAKQVFIPRELMQNGIDLCKQNVSDFLKDAKLIVSEGRLDHAYVIVEFAIEEFGKIVMLNEALSLNTNDPILVNESVFKSHNEKSTKAWVILNPKYRIIFDEGAYDENVYDPRFYQTNTTASHNTRLEFAFVGFDGNRWVLGREIKKSLLENLITHVDDMLTKI